ncbi:MAG: LapA family protein [Alphaproteobacteria bacterium]|nr:LapA family protein [Alphaproteobacteria bacterium]
MRLFLWVLSLPVFGAVVVFVLQNRFQVPVSFWPFDVEVTLPVSILALGCLIIGFVAGALVTGLGQIKTQFEARRLRKDVAALKDKVEQAQSPLPCAPTILYKGRYQHPPENVPKSQGSRWSRWFQK